MEFLAADIPRAKSRRQTFMGPGSGTEKQPNSGSPKRGQRNGDTPILLNFAPILSDLAFLQIRQNQTKSARPHWADPFWEFPINIKFLGGIFLWHQGPRRGDIEDKNFIQVAFFCCFRQGVARMSGIWVRTSRIWKNFMQESFGLKFRSLLEKV